MNARAFLRFLFGDDPPGHVVLWTRRDKTALWLPAQNLEAAGRLSDWQQPVTFTAA